MRWRSVSRKIDWSTLFPELDLPKKCKIDVLTDLWPVDMGNVLKTCFIDTDPDKVRLPSQDGELV